VKSWSEVSLGSELGLSQNISIKNDDKTYHLGFKTGFNTSEGIFGLNCFAAFVASGFSWGKFWMRGNLLSRMFAVGSTVNFDKQ
jgi:hypothetical protein